MENVEVVKEESNTENTSSVSFDQNGNPTTKDGNPVVVSKEDLESISKQQNQLLTAQSVLGSLVIKKIELASQIIGLRKNQDVVIQSILEKYGIPPQEAAAFGINQRTGQVLRNNPQN